MKLVPEMTYTETIDGPWGPTTGSPFGTRLCWQVWSARLTGPRIDARLAMPGHDWVRVGPDGVRRQDLRVTMVTQDDAVVLLRYDVALIRESPRFLAALTSGESTDYADQYMRIAPVFDTGAADYDWLTDSLFLGEGRVAGARQIEYSIYRVD